MQSLHTKIFKVRQQYVAANLQKVEYPRKLSTDFIK